MPIVINTKEFVDEVHKIANAEGWCRAEDFLRDDLGLIFDQPIAYGRREERMQLTDGAPETLDAQRVAEVAAKARALYPSESKDGIAKILKKFGLPDLHFNDKITVTISLDMDTLADVGWDPIKETTGQWRQYIRDAIDETDREGWKVESKPDPRRARAARAQAKAASMARHPSGRTPEDGAERVTLVEFE